MTPKEYAKATKKLAAEIGSRGRVSTFINDDRGHAIRACVYSNWPASDRLFEVEGDTFSETLEAVKAKWSDYQDTYRRATTRKMALKIIEITAAHGHCTDAALRGGYDFTEEEVTRFGSAACVDANEIAGKGPFEIVTLGGANGAPEETASQHTH